MTRQKEKRSFYNHTLQWVLAVLASIFFIVAVLNLIGIPFRVTESHVCKEFSEGDIIWLSKYGAGIRTPLQWNPIKSSASSKAFDLNEYSRLNSLSISRFEPIAYNSAQPLNRIPDEKPIYISRTIGLPGDTVSFYRGKLYINGEAKDSTDFEILAYRAHLDNKLIDTLFWDTLQTVQLLSYIDKGNETEISFASYTKDALVIAGHPATVSFYRLLEERSNPIVYQNGLNDQNGDNYGPVILPAKGDTVYFDSMSIYHANVLADFERAYDQNELLEEYWVWKNDYFFTLSDYRKKGHDSRFFGPIPEYLIVAKPGPILISAN